MITDKIKSLISGTAAVLMLGGILTSCDEKVGLPEKPEMKISGTMLVFPMDGGEQVLDFETNRDWTASVDASAVSSDVSWCHISAEKGAPGKNSIVINVDPLEGDYREATLILNASAAGKDIRICQTGKPVVTTAAAEEITEARAKFTVTWIYSGDIDIVEMGMALSKNVSDWEYKAFSDIEEFVSGTYSQYIEGLEAATVYKFKAYVKDADGNIYEGSEMEFTTDTEPVRISIKTLKGTGREIPLGGQNKYADNEIIEAVVIASYNKPVEIPEEPESKAVSTTETKILVTDGIKAHNGITIYLPDEENPYIKGDKVSVRLKDGTLRHDNSDAVNFVPVSSGALALISQGNEVSAMTAGHTELDKFESMYVMIEDTQLTKQYTGFETWTSSETMMFEVNGSETGYEVMVPATAEIASEAPKTGSGTIYGIVMTDGQSGYKLVCENASDVEGLTGERFKSLLEFNYLAPQLVGSLEKDTKISKTTIDIGYRYSEGNISFEAGTITVEVSGPGAEGITVEPNEALTLDAGSGTISLKVTGTPITAGEVTFTVNGIEGLTENTCTAEVKEPFKPEIGNFDCVWNLSVEKGNTAPVNWNKNTNETSITVAPLCLKGNADLAANITATKWSGRWGAKGWNLNTGDNYLTSPVQYFETSLTVISGTLDLSGLDLEAAETGSVSIQYSVNGGAFRQIGDRYTDLNITVALSNQEGLTGITTGSTVVFRILNISTNAAEKWGIDGTKGSADPTQRSLAIYGNVR